MSVAVADETIRFANGMRVVLDKEVGQATRALVRAWARAWDELRTTWADAMMDLATQSADGVWPSPWTIARSAKAQAALAATLDNIHDLAYLSGVTVVDSVGRVVDQTHGFEAKVIASQFPEQAGTFAELVTRFDRVDPVAIRAIVARSTQQITAATWRLDLAAQEVMRRVLIQGVAVGTNPRTAAREMVRRAEHGFNGGLTRATTIARTEMLDAYRLAAADVHFGAADVLTGWTWLASLDSRTCPSCWGMHGTVHDLSEDGPHDHQNGRCARLPTVKAWAELGFDIPEPKSVIPDAQDVFAGMSRTDRLAVMGPARLQALDDGLIGWGDLSQHRSTPGWRDSWHTTPVRDLLASRPG